MERWKRDARRDVAIIDIEALVPKDHLLRKAEEIFEHILNKALNNRMIDPKGVRDVCQGEP